RLQPSLPPAATPPLSTLSLHDALPICLNTWLARLPMEAKEKDEWRYWQADLLLERGREAEAKEILHQLMQQRGFYPMVAAQRIEIGRAVQQECRDRSRMPSSA